ncbi:MAG: hypothetical protein NVSMB14_13880 [Isosphaeraceae bacterium]
MAFIALAAVWMAFEPKVRDRWQSLVDQAGMQEQLAGCDELDAAYMSQYVLEWDTRVKNAEAMTPDQKLRRQITTDDIKWWKFELVDQRKFIAARTRSKHARLESARQLRKRWW